ncbi:MAG: beta-galactosidase [Anaerolineaceae bacterium]
MFYFGAAYYPEQWPEESWIDDIRLMRKAGMNVLRLGEFAWSTLQPAQDELKLDWLAKAIDLLGKEGISTILGTPTASPPAWLVDQHPDLMAMDDTGHQVQFGMRCHYCVNSPEFQEAAEKIVWTLGEHFGSNPNVIGWQLDNEYNRICYCERCRNLFQHFLEEKYGSLDTLNKRWSTRYWSQTYSSWKQIPLPIGVHNPALRLEFKHFVTASYRKFQKLQVEALRTFIPPDVRITHNFMGWFSEFNHYEMNEELDIASWDYYIPSGHHDFMTSGATHDLTHGFKRKNFWLMETQPGSVNWAEVNSVPDKGELRAVAWHAVAHGAEALLYWQWRSAYGGQEQYHGTLVDQSGEPRPFFTEAEIFGNEIARLSKLIEGLEVNSEVAILNDYDSHWSIDFQPHHKDFSYTKHLLSYYKPFSKRNVPVDIISADAHLDKYKLVIAPTLIILQDNQVNELNKFVANGGHLILTIRTGMKDRFNAFFHQRQPGPLASVAGVEVEEFYALQEPVPVIGDQFQGTSRLWAERLKLVDDNTKTLASFGVSNGWLDGQPAITVHPSGRGLVYYMGAYLDEESQQVFINQLLEEMGLRPVLETPVGVEARKLFLQDKGEIFIVINHQNEPRSVEIPEPYFDNLKDQVLKGIVPLAPFQVLVLTKPEKRPS